MRALKFIQRKFILIPLLTFALTQCSQSPIIFPGQIKGSEAKKQILTAVQEADILASVQFAADLAATCKGLTGAQYSSCMSYNSTLMPLLTILVIAIDNLVVPIILNIDDNKNYEKNTVDDCANKIRLLGMSPDIGTWIPAMFCNIE